MNELFESKDVTSIEAHNGTGHKCNECKHAKRWQCGSMFIWYCHATSDNHTFNKFMKIKARRPACRYFEVTK